MTKLASTVGAYEAKTRFSELLQRVERGDEITVTRHGKPVAKLVPLRRHATPQERAEAIARWRKIGAGIGLGGLKIKDLIAEGRK